MGVLGYVMLELAEGKVEYRSRGNSFRRFDVVDSVDRPGN